MPTVRERNRLAVEKLTYQDVTAAQQIKIDAMRKAAQGFAKVVIKNTEPGPESTLAQRRIEDALNRAIRSVIFEWPPPDDASSPTNGRAAKRAAKGGAPVKKAGAVKRRRQPA
jgi:hypothetical protein